MNQMLAPLRLVRNSFAGWLLIMSCMLYYSCSSPAEQHAPPENRFRKVVLAQGLTQLKGAINFEISATGQIYFIDLGGNLKIFDPASKNIRIAGKFDGGEFGLIGLKLDPQFEKNHFIYLQYFVGDTSHSPEGTSKRIMHISRFTMQHDSLATSSEQTYITIPYEFECCHTGGGMDFDNEGNLYASTGDNTGAFFSQYSPMALLPGHFIDDGLRSSGNTNDDRGKILRIHPLDSGGFSIPRDNLFPKGTRNTKPEIYVMGVRNPYRLTIDRKTDMLYWGEVGPDAGKDSAAGPKGYDEFNSTKVAGNFGWPLIIGNNQPYARATYTITADARPPVIIPKYGPTNDPGHPKNNSPHNTGLKDLPPAHPALIWYPYDSSSLFPSFGAGGRTAIGGPFYQYLSDDTSSVKFPKWFDHCWFIADWMRNWIKIVHFKEDHSISHIDDFLPGTSFIKPMCMKFGPDGALYVLEFGTTWSEDNPDVKLSKIEFIPGNRLPVARISAVRKTGDDLLTITAIADSSSDPDGDPIEYVWTDETGRTISKGAALRFSFSQPGLHSLSLQASDSHGGVTTTDTSLWAGRAPSISIDVSNRSFYWDTVRYSVSVNDGKSIIPPANVDTSQARVYEEWGMPVSGADENDLVRGEVLMNESDCKACHQIEKKSVGPSFIQVANRYRSDQGAIARLTEKIIRGGSGVWGQANMSAHPQLQPVQVALILKYIFSLQNKNSERKNAALRGSMPASAQSGKRVKLTAAYMPKGGFGRGMTFGDSVLLRSALVYGRDFDRHYDANVSGDTLKGHTFSFAVLRNVDLAHVSGADLRANGPVDIHLDNEKGPLVARFNIKKSPELKSASVVLPHVDGIHDLFIVFAMTDQGFIIDQSLQQIRFMTGNK